MLYQLSYIRISGGHPSVPAYACDCSHCYDGLVHTTCGVSLTTLTQCRLFWLIRKAKHKLLRQEQVLPPLVHYLPRFYASRLELVVRVELTTYRLQGGCSAIEP